MRWIYFSFVVLPSALVACYAFTPYVSKLENSGPRTINDWRDRYHKLRGHYPSKAETDAFRSKLKHDVELYIAANPGLSDLQKSELRTLDVHLGMTKSEVKLFLNGVVLVQRDLALIAKEAGNLWPELQPGIDESWEYDTYIYYFAGQILVNIVHRIPALQPL